MMLSFREEKKMLEKHLEVEDKLLSLFTQDKIDEKLLYNILEEMNKFRKKKLEINKEVLKQKDVLNPEILQAYSVCLKEINTISEKLTINEIPTFNIANVTNFLNIFSDTYLTHESQNLRKHTEENEIKDGYEKKKEADNNGKIIVLANDESVPLKFKNGRKILLTVNNFDLSIFTSDELIELLRLLDIIVSDNKYDVLRSEITKQIAIISTISLLKE
jgi:hypothetical protein